MKSLDANNNERILKHGYLLKQSDLLKQWNLRYFVLSKECLCYYKTEEQSVEDVPKEVIFFNDMSLYIDELPEKQTKYCLKLVKRSVSAGKIATRTNHQPIIQFLVTPCYTEVAVLSSWKFWISKAPNHLVMIDWLAHCHQMGFYGT